MEVSCIFKNSFSYFPIQVPIRRDLESSIQLLQTFRFQTSISMVTGKELGIAKVKLCIETQLTHLYIKYIHHLTFFNEKTEHRKGIC